MSMLQCRRDYIGGPPAPPLRADHAALMASHPSGPAILQSNNPGRWSTAIDRQRCPNPVPGHVMPAQDITRKLTLLLRHDNGEDGRQSLRVGTPEIEIVSPGHHSAPSGESFSKYADTVAGNNRAQHWQSLALFQDMM
jgi:hypothetical protein